MADGPDLPTGDPTASPAAAPDTATGIDSALPSVGARVLAFAAVLVGGACGGLIGWSLARLQYGHDNQVAQGLGALIGAVLAAVGTAVVAVLVLRAMTEWRSGPKTPPRRYSRS